MADDTQQPQLDPSFDYAKLPDGSYAKFAKGTNPLVIQAKLAGAGLIKPKPYSGPIAETKPDVTLPKAYGFTPRNMAKNLVEGGKGVVKGSYDIAATAMKPHSQGGGVEPALNKIFDPMREQFKQAKSAYNNNQLMAAATHFVAGSIPMLGPAAADLGTQAGTGDIGGASTKALGMYLTGKGTEAVSKTAGDFVDPVKLRQRAGDLNTKVLKTAEEGKLNKTDAGLQVAQEQIVSNMKKLPAKIEQVRQAKNAKVEALAKYHDAQGHTVDAETDLAPRLRNIAQRMNTRGLLDTQTISALKQITNRITQQVDMQTGKMIPRNLKSMKVSEALALTKGLGETTNWDSASVATEPFRKEIRQVINDAVDKVDPEIGKTRAEESRLIKARDAADKQFTAMKNEKLATATGIFRSNAPTIGIWLGLRALGLMAPVTALGTVILMKTMAESTLSRTARAALYAKAADLLDRTFGTAPSAPNATTGPNVPQVPPSKTLGPNTPQRAANAGKVPPTAGSPQGGPMAPRAGLPTMPGASPQFTVSPPRGLPAKATRAKPGSGDYVKKSTSTVPDTPAAVVSAVETKPAGAVKPEGQTVAKSTTPSDVSTRNKAMMDRLDTLLTRKPGSGAENNAIKREIDQIKRLISGEATGAEASAINKRIADRERLAGKRAEAGATQKGTQATGTVESVSQAANPEQRAMALDAGYKALEKFEGGKMMAQALRNTAKAMQKVDPSYDEVEKLTEAITILKSMPAEDIAGAAKRVEKRMQ